LNKEIRIIVVDDEPTIADGLRLVLRAEDYTVDAAGTLAEALEAVERAPCDLVITDVQLPDDVQGGLNLLTRVRSRNPDTEVIIVTGYGSVEQAVEATKAGAFYFVEKPFDPAQMLLLVEKALERRRLLAESVRLRKHLQRHEYFNMIGASKAMQTIYETIESVAKTDVNVLIVGESGTGKELIANAIHFNSLRSSREFVKVNCSALPKGLIESELFGYSKGAFTGASQNHVGLIAQSKGGSLLLDEIGEMPIDLQPKLLRVLEERRYRPVGSSESFEADFRLISATNRPALQAVRDGILREDLFYRLSTITIHVPPLSQRSEDLQLLIEHFFQYFKERYDRPLTGLSRSAYQRLFAYRWPGNVRELQNVMERAILLSKGPRIEPEDLPFVTKTSGAVLEDFQLPPNMTLAEIERIVISKTLQQTHGNKQAAAQILGIYRPRLYNKIKKYNIETGRRRRRKVKSVSNGDAGGASEPKSMPPD